MMSNIDIKSYIPHGPKNAIKNRDLAAMLGMSRRDVFMLVERERINGEIIIATTGGYCLPEYDENGNMTPESIDALKQFFYAQHARGIGCLRSAKSARLAIKAAEERGKEPTV